MIELYKKQIRPVQMEEPDLRKILGDWEDEDNGTRAYLEDSIKNLHSHEPTFTLIFEERYVPIKLDEVFNLIIASEQRQIKWLRVESNKVYGAYVDKEVIRHHQEWIQNKLRPHFRTIDLIKRLMRCLNMGESIEED